MVAKLVHLGVKRIQGQCWLSHCYAVWTGSLISQSSCPSKEARVIPTTRGWRASRDEAPKWWQHWACPGSSQTGSSSPWPYSKVFYRPSRSLWLHFLKQRYAGKAWKLQTLRENQRETCLGFLASHSQKVFKNNGRYSFASLYYLNQPSSLAEKVTQQTSQSLGLSTAKAIKD